MGYCMQYARSEDRVTDEKKINDGDYAADISYRDQPLSETAISEMKDREEWNIKNPANEVTLVKNLRETELVPREYRNTKARFMKLTGERRAGIGGDRRPGMFAGDHLERDDAK